jgi:hypothetical protein
MGISTSYGTIGTESGVTLVERMYKPDGIERAVVVCHGRGELGVTGALYSGQTSLLRSLAQTFPVVENDLTGSAHWGKDAALTKLGDSVAYALGTLGGLATKVYLWAISMGTLPAIRYLLANPTKVAALALTVPVTDLVYQHDTNPAGFASEIETTLGISGTYAGNSTITAMDPNQQVAAIAATGVPVKAWIASDDTTAVTARQQAFITALGCDSVNAGAVGHTYAATTVGEIDTFFAAH